MNKKIFFAAFLLLACMAPFAHAEQIDSYDSRIEIANDGTGKVYESIQYDFGDLEKHGIFRTIPRSTSPGGIGRIELSDFSVMNEANEPYNFSDESSGSTAQYRIGDADVLVSGKKFYDIRYNANNTLGYFPDFTEIYWNLIGTEWEVPIAQVHGEVLLDFEPATSSVKIYCGSFGKKEVCADWTLSTKKTDTATAQTRLIFDAKKEFLPFPPGYGMTVAVSFPRGFVSSEPAEGYFKWRTLYHYLLNSLFFLPFVLAPLFFTKRFRNLRAWRAYRRSHSLIAEYDASGYSPAEIGFLYRESFGSDDAAAEITYLIAQGYIDAKKGEDGDVSFSRTTKSATNLKEHQTILLEAIAGHKESELKDTLYDEIMEFKKKVSKNIVDQGLVVGKMPSFWRSQGFNRTTVLFLTFFLALNPGIFIWIGGSFLLDGGWRLGYVFSMTVILIGIITLIFKGRYKISYSPAGFDAKMKALGLYLYIDVAEKDKIVFDANPERTLEIAEKLLPFAMVFGMEKKWLAYLQKMLDLSGIDKTKYEYHSSLINNYVFATSFASHLQNSATAAHNAQAARSMAASSWSSGSSGGSSGGGGGGGGGGSW